MAYGLPFTAYHSSMKNILQVDLLLEIYATYFLLKLMNCFCYNPSALSMETIFRKARDFNGEICGDWGLRP